MFQQKGSNQILLLVVIFVIISLLGTIYYFRNTQESPAPPVLNNQTVSTPSSNINQELGDFPIYPGATFIERKVQDPCPPDHSGYSTCDMTTYLFTSKDDFDQITSWYSEDPNKTGWSCGGGGGSYDSPRSASGVKSCQKGEMDYALYLSATAEKTEFQVGVPSKR